MPANTDKLSPKVVLGVAAHPDDLDFGAAGTLAHFAAQGAAVYYLIITDGSKGTDNLSLSPPELVKLRQQEQRAASKMVGARDIFFLNYPDGELEVTMALKKDIVRVIRQVKPDIVITMDPSMIYSASRGFINHPDHRAAGQAALDAIFPLARDHLSFPDLYAAGLQPHKTSTVLLVNFDDSDYIVDISDTFESKMAAIQAHASQVHDVSQTRAWMEQIAAKTGARAGCKLAEAFVRIDITST